MKVALLIFTAIAACCCQASAQLLNWTPAFPTDASALTITLDAAQGDRGLLNYSDPNDVYVHIGVITNLSTSSDDWRYVPFQWGTTDVAAHATSLGNNKYQYTISNIRSFFNVPAGETILKIAVLFRNGNGNSAARCSDGSNMYVPVYAAGALAVRFTQPVFEPRYTPYLPPQQYHVGDALPVTAIASQASALTVFFNNTPVQTAANATTISASPTATGCTQAFRVEATQGGVTAKDSFSYFISPAVQTADLPTGVRDGINYLPGDTSAVLVLFAPGKTSANVIGDFNNWSLSCSSQLYKTTDGQRFWILLNHLVPGTEYAYQYIVDDTLRIADPYTEKVLDPDNDPFIDAATYPNLKAYPTGKTTGIVSVLQTAAPAYTWQAVNYQKPASSNLLIYELCLRDFIGAHNWQTLQDTLSYLQRLGVNAIEVMPFSEFEGNISWGYNPSFYFAPDKYYGTKNALKAFIDACHSRGMAVIQDIVLNHSCGTSPMVQLYFSNGAPAANSPWYNTVPTHPDNVCYDFNHESLATKYFVQRVLDHWLTEYRMDGFRFDLSKGFTQNVTTTVDAWSAYDPSRIAIWKRYADSVRTKHADAYMILEHFAADQEEKELSDYGFLLWGNMNYNYNEATMGYVANSDISRTYFTTHTFTKPSVVAYAESHDEERLMYKNLQFGYTNTTNNYNVKSLTTALQRQELAAAFLLNVPGPKMIWEFGELGYDQSIFTCSNGTVPQPYGSDQCRTDPKPILWNYQNDSTRNHLYYVYSSLYKLRKDQATMFSSGTFTMSVTDTLKQLTIAQNDLSMVVLGNFGVGTCQRNVTFPSAGNWYDYLTGSVIAATGNPQPVSLAPGAYRIYLNRNLSLTTPVTTVPSRNDSLFIRVLPNPASADAQVQYTIPEGGNVSMTLYNTSGAVLGALQLGYRTAHQPQQLPLRSISGGALLAPGVYWLRMYVNNRYNVCQFIKD